MKKTKTVDDVLLAIAGNRVAHMDTGYDDLIAAKGKLFKPRLLDFLPGEERNCHRNSSSFFLMYYPEYDIVTGYTMLSDREVWVRHTWLMPRHVNKTRIVDTTCARDLYFGVRLDEKETARFVMNDVLPCLPGLKDWQ